MDYYHLYIIQEKNFFKYKILKTSILINFYELYRKLY